MLGFLAINFNSRIYIMAEKTPLTAELAKDLLKDKPVNTEKACAIEVPVLSNIGCLEIKGSEKLLEFIKSLKQEGNKALDAGHIMVTSATNSIDNFVNNPFGSSTPPQGKAPSADSPRR
jgi:hypothetical protein